MMIQWFPICGFEGLYEWSPQLEVVRGLKSGNIKQWNYDNQGRPYVTLYKNGKARNFYMAMIIYSHVHQVEIHLGYQVHHIDGDWTNNSTENLQLLTRGEHMKIHGEERSKAVVAIDEHNHIVHRFSSTAEAGRNGFGQRNVSAACRGCFNREGNHYFKGYYWYFEQEWLRLQ